MGAERLPKHYAWLARVKGPKLVVEFIKLFGISEVKGSGSNPIILKWAKTLGLKDYTHDGIAWCGLLMAWLCYLTGKPIPLKPLWALNWQYWGRHVPKGQEMFGDILVFYRYDSRGKLIGGHVGLYIAEDRTHFHVGGGNSTDQNIIVRIEKKRLAACRRPDYINQPIEVKKVWVDAEGIISENEA